MPWYNRNEGMSWMLHCHGMIKEHVSACYNPNGAMGVKHQVIYLQINKEITAMN